MSRWTSRRAILRDLSLAQGGCAAGAGAERRGARGGEEEEDAASALAPCDRPPPALCREETEEEYLKQYVSGAAEAGEGQGEPLKPDLRLIRQMLDMVRDLNVSEEEVIPDDVAVISKLNPFSSKFLPRYINCKSKVKKLPAEETCPPRSSPPPKKQKKQRNVALASILRGLQNQQKNSSVECNGALTPRTPCNRTTDLQDPTSIDTQEAEFKENSNLVANNIRNETDARVQNGEDRVKEWMARMSGPARGEPPGRLDTLSLDTSRMFKKKSRASAGCEGSSASSARSTATAGSGAGGGCGAYVPSPRADLYYQKYLERSRLRESMREDIWTKAERIMRSIDDNKRLEAAQGGSSEADAKVETRVEAQVDAEVDADPLRCVRLAAPRHAPGRGAACPVCAACLAPAPAPATPATPAPPATTPPPRED